MALLSYTNADSSFEDGVADAKGSYVLTRFDDIKDFLNGGSLDTTNNIDPSGVFAWTARHGWSITDTSNNNFSIAVVGVMAASKYGHYLTSSAAQINSALSYKSLTNASSSVPVEQIVNAGTGDSHKVVNSNTGACYKAETTSTGNPFEAKVRTLDDLSAPLVSKVISSPTALEASTTETAVVDTILTLPADFLKVGTTIKGTLYGLIDSPAAPADLTIKVRYGGVAGTILLTTGAVTPTANLVDSLVKIEFLLTCASIGAAGTMESQGLVLWNSNTAPTARGMGVAATGTANGSAIAIDTTLSKDLVVTVVWSAATAGCNIEIRNGVLELKR